LAIGLRTDIDVAEAVKLKYASLGKVERGDLSFVKDGETLKFDREMLKIIVEARLEELLEFVDKEFKKIHRSRRLPGGIVLTGGTAKLPGIAEFAREVLELPARVGKWGHINKIVDGLDEEIFTPAVGLMLLDMLLGPPQPANFSETQPGMLESVNESFNGLLRRLRRRG
jgi:cell division protein FtsA